MVDIVIPQGEWEQKAEKRIGMDSFLDYLYYLPIILLLIWRWVVPYMLCRDVKNGTVTEEAVHHIAIEGLIYLGVGIYLMTCSVGQSKLLWFFLFAGFVAITGIWALVNVGRFYICKKKQN